MTPRERYMERRRLRAERLLHEERREADAREQQAEAEDIAFELIDAVARVAEALEGLLAVYRETTR